MRGKYRVDKDVELVAKKIREIILIQSKRANVGHIGSALSVVEIIASLYSVILKISTPEDPDRDRFILSKGHSVLTLYAALYLKGWISKQQLDTYCGDGSLLGVHPEHRVRGVDVSTGSLGFGLSVGVGLALAGQKQQSKRRVFVLVSDAECNEGSLWEAVMFAAHHRLPNLIAIVDDNRQQAFGYTDEILSLSPLGDRWRVFGWDVHEIDGHNIKEIIKTINDLDMGHQLPHVLIAKTTSGKGVSYMEGQIKWHYLPMNEKEYQRALKEIGS